MKSLRMHLAPPTIGIEDKRREQMLMMAPDRVIPGLYEAGRVSIVWRVVEETEAYLRWRPWP